MLKFARTVLLGLMLASPTLPGALYAQYEQSPAARPAPVPAPPAAPLWKRSAVQELLAYVEAIGAEGLEPADYRPDRLRAALAAGDDAAVQAAATDTFLHLTRDLVGGHVPDADRRSWHMPPNALNFHDQQAMMARAMEGGVFDVLHDLLPTHAQYLGLRRALALTPPEDQARRDLIRANMERWRWMPRDLGRRHVIVNVPAFTAAMVDEGRVVARHRVIVGKPGTPTPQLSTMATGVTFNPWWNVPQSIIPELGRMRGYEVRRQGGNLIVRQPPGPRNALGRVKIEMQNPHAIYLHDTPAQALFERDVRAFSHGCIRTQNVRDFAATMLAPTGEWDRAAIDAAIQTGKTRTATLTEPVPVYIVYFTAAATQDGEIVTYRDLYGRDGSVREALNRTAAGGGAVQAQIAD